MRQACALVIVLAAPSLWAQGPVAFDAASVKVNRSGSSDSTVRTAPGGIYSATNITLGRLIPNAFNVLPFQVSGGPGWLATERFDITAKPPADAKAEDLPAMLQAMLAERFALKTHREQQDQPIYALTLVTDGRLGPKLTKSSFDCDRVEAEKRITPECQAMMGISRGGGMLSFKGRSLARLGSVLGSVVSRVVVDQSGLPDKYDLELKWSAGDAAASSTDPEIFSAIREQLGLQLKPATGKVEVLVIDSADRPTAD